MLKRVNRLAYALVGAALAAALAVGLFISASVRPQATLTASESCYGPCTSVTALSLSKATVVYGREHAEKFRVRVTSGTSGTGVPTGRVAVKSGSRTLCTIRLHSGKGTCSPAARALKPGRRSIVAYYGGSASFKPSMSMEETVFVRRHSYPDMTRLSLSRARVVYGHEQLEKFTVKVSSDVRGRGVPSGRVAVTSGTQTLCTIRLHNGKGTCKPAASALKPGQHKIVAYYSGDENFKPSTSTKKKLVVRH